MEPELNFYDLAGYFMPGAMALLLLYWLAIGFFALPFTVSVQSFGEAVIFIAAAYFLGHLVQVLGNAIERRHEMRWGGKFQEQFLRGDNRHYTPQFKAHLKEQIELIFSLSVPNDGQPADVAAQTRARQEIFNLCYSLIVQENAAQHTEVFQGIYGLYRGILATAWVGILISLFVAAKHLALLVCSMQNLALPPAPFFRYDAVQLESSVILFVFLVSARPLLPYRLKRFSEHFANSVYRSFYAWCVKQGLRERAPEVALPIERHGEA